MRKQKKPKKNNHLFGHWFTRNEISEIKNVLFVIRISLSALKSYPFNKFSNRNNQLLNDDLPF